MNSWTLYLFELKKIMRSKATVITLSVMTLGFVCLVLVNAYADGIADFTKASWRSVAGRTLDDQLLTEIQASSDLNGSLLQIEDNGHRAVGRWLKRATGNSMNLDGIPVLDYQTVTADELYQKRLEVIHRLMEEFHCSPSEMEWWMRKDAQIQSPYVFQYSVTPREWISTFQFVTTMVLLLAAVCLAGVFANERSLKTDQLIFSSLYGKRRLFLIKIAAGETFIFASALCAVIVCFLPYPLFFGAEGFDAVYQIAKPLSSYPYTIGTMLVIYLIVYLTSALLYGMAAMSLSLFTKSGIAASGVMIVSLIVSMFFQIPPQYRTLSQLWNLRPTGVLVNSSFDDYRLFRIGEHYLTSFQTGPVLYIVLIALFLLISRAAYDRSQA